MLIRARVYVLRAPRVAREERHRAHVERLHDPRYGSANVLADASTPLSVLKERLGHHSLRVTEVHLHSSPEAQPKAAETIEGTLSARRQSAS